MSSHTKPWSGHLPLLQLSAATAPTTALVTGTKLTCLLGGFCIGAVLQRNEISQQKDDLASSETMPVVICIKIRS